MRNIPDAFHDNITSCCLPPPYRQSDEYRTAVERVRIERRARHAGRIVEAERFATNTWQYQRRFTPKVSPISHEIRTRPTALSIRRARQYRADCQRRMAKAGRFGSR